MDKRHYDIMYLVAQLASENFEAAMAGLLSGHAKAIQKYRDDYSKIDRAFLMALSLSERGARLDKSGIMEKAIAEGIQQSCGSSQIEKEFIERVNNKDKPNE